MASQPGPGPSGGPSPVKRSFSDSMGLRQMGPSPIKRACQSIEVQQQKELDRLLKKESFLETQLAHLIEALRKRYDDERQAIAEEQRRLADRLLEINNMARNEEDALKERSNLKLIQVRHELEELRKRMSHGGLRTSSSESHNPSIPTLRGVQEEVDNEVVQNSATGREDLGSTAQFEHDLSPSQQSEVVRSSPEVHQQPNEESDGEISSSSDILILQAAGLLAETGEAGDSVRTGEQGSGCTSQHIKNQESSEVVADSSGADQKEDPQEPKDKEKDTAFLKLKTISTSFEEELQCSICNELLVAAVTINCAHSFCKYCLGEWKKQRAECPMCRVPITAEHRSVTLDSVISSLVGQLSVELQQRHKEVLDERAAIDAAAAAVAALVGPAAPAGGAAAPNGAARQGAAPGRGGGGGGRHHHHHHHNYNWQPHPAAPPPYAHHHAHFPPHAHGYPLHGHPPPPPHAHPPLAHPPHAHPPHAHPPHAHHPIAQPPPHVHVPPPPAHVQPARARTPPGPPDSPDHHLRLRRRQGRNILSSGSSSESSTDEPSDSQSSYSSNGGYSNNSDNSWFDAQYMSAEYDEDEDGYAPAPGPAPAPEVPGIPGRYYGGYGVCFYCNQRGHWSNGCPVRFGF